MELFDLTGKRALVTGSSRGIGRAIAEALLEAGAHVVVNGVNDRLFQTAQELMTSTGGVVIPIQADLSKREETKHLFNESVNKLGGLDILVVNHGIQRSHPAEAFPIEDWDTVLEVDLSSLFMLDQMGGQHMLRHGGGKIINIASLISVIGGMTVPAYAAAKGGVVQLTKAFSNEWAGRGVNVNAIVPGFIHTDLTEDLVNDPGEGANLLARIPVGRWGVPDDLKGVAVFLASAASNYVTGAVIPVDGGFLVR
ncbi:MAG: SDR family oxidoreductase [Anaerolineaceae bacterium]|nr:SDR family oxidoreductase [Anaerolineaceae bacterium]